MKNMNNYISAESYAQKHGMIEANVIAEVKAGNMVGRLYNGEWLIEESQVEIEKIENKDVNVTQRRAGRVGFLFGFFGVFTWAFLTGGFYMGYGTESTNLILVPVAAFILGFVNAGLFRWAMK